MRVRVITLSGGCALPSCPIFEGGTTAEDNTIPKRVRSAHQFQHYSSVQTPLAFSVIWSCL